MVPVLRPRFVLAMLATPASDHPWPAPLAPVIPVAVTMPSFPAPRCRPTERRSTRRDFDATKAAELTKLVPALNMAGSELNAFGVAGVPAGNVRFVLAFTERRSTESSTRAHYRAKFGVSNSNTRTEPKARQKKKKKSLSSVDRTGGNREGDDDGSTSSFGHTRAHRAVIGPDDGQDQGEPETVPGSCPGGGRWKKPVEHPLAIPRGTGPRVRDLEDGRSLSSASGGQPGSCRTPREANGVLDERVERLLQSPGIRAGERIGVDGDQPTSWSRRSPASSTLVHQPAHVDWVAGRAAPLVSSASMSSKSSRQVAEPIQLAHHLVGVPLHRPLLTAVHAQELHVARARSSRVCGSRVTCRAGTRAGVSTRDRSRATSSSTWRCAAVAAKGVPHHERDDQRQSGNPVELVELRCPLEQVGANEDHTGGAS